MNVKEEIQREKQRIAQEWQRSHNKMVEEARVIIPEVVSNIKKTAIIWATRGYHIQKRGILNRRKYVEVNWNDRSSAYHHRLLYNCPELYAALREALAKAGFENISIHRNLDLHRLYITVWLDIAK